MSTIQRFSGENGLSIDVFRETRITLQSDLDERYDCNYRSPEYFRTIKTIRATCKKQGWRLEKVGEINGLKVKVGSTPKGRESFSTISGIPFIKTKNVYKGYLKTDNLSFLTKEAHRKNNANSIKDGDVLLTIIGANFDVIGRAYLFNHHDLDDIKVEEANINQNIARLNGIPDAYDKNYFEHFLNSRSGQAQIRRFSKQSVQVNLSTNEVKLVHIPRPPKELQKRIAKIVLQGRKIADKIKAECDRQVEKVNQELLDVAGISLPKVEVRSFQSCILDQLNVNFYHPKYVKLLKDLENQEKMGRIHLKRLRDVSPRISRKCSLDDQNTYRYIELGDVDVHTGKVISCKPILGSDPPSRAKWEIKENYLLVPTLKGSSKKVAMVDKEFEDCIASSGFVIFSLQNEALRFYLFAVLRSPIVQLQYEKRATGSIMADVRPDVVEDFCIPLPRDTEVFHTVTAKIKERMGYIMRVYGEAERIIQQTESIFNKVVLGHITIEQAEELSSALYHTILSSYS